MILFSMENIYFIFNNNNDNEMHWLPEYLCSSGNKRFYTQKPTASLQNKNVSKIRQFQGEFSSS